LHRYLKAIPKSLSQPLRAGIWSKYEGGLFVKAFLNANRYLNWGFKAKLSSEGWLFWCAAGSFWRRSNGLVQHATTSKEQPLIVCIKSHGTGT
jgi:hypothetical protein